MKRDTFSDSYILLSPEDLIDENELKAQREKLIAKEEAGKPDGVMTLFPPLYFYLTRQRAEQVIKRWLDAPPPVLSPRPRGWDEDYEDYVISLKLFCSKCKRIGCICTIDADASGDELTLFCRPNIHRIGPNYAPLIFPYPAEQIERLKHDTPPLSLIDGVNDWERGIQFDYDELRKAKGEGVLRSYYSLACPSCGGGRIYQRAEKLEQVFIQLLESGVRAMTLQEMARRLSNRKRT